MSGLGTWDVTWERCPNCPAPVMPDKDHQCLDLTAVKWGGTETLTDEEWARRRRTAELSAPSEERARAKMAETIDGMIAKTGTTRTPPWNVGPSPDPIEDIKRAVKAMDEAPSREVRELSRQIQGQAEAIAHRRREQVEAHIERHLETIQGLQARGIDVWLEEGPTQFSSGEDGDRWSLRATSTVRIRFAGDGL